MEFKEYCLSKAGTSPDFPFDQETLVLKVGTKMFALVNINGNPVSVNLKCDPLLAQDLRSRYEDVIPGYHMNKKHWNTVRIDGALGEDLVREMIDLSYDLVFRGLTRKERDEIQKTAGV